MEEKDTELHYLQMLISFYVDHEDKKHRETPRENQRRIGKDEGLRIVVWGTGRTGLDTAREMIRQGHEVRLVDEKVPRQSGELPVSLLKEDDMKWADLVIPSPGIPRFHSMLGRAKKVLSEIEVAARLLTGTLIAVTGSNGKTTTTTLIHRILTRAGLDAGIGGNISPPLISLVERNPQYIVAEISSFQLEWIEHFRPRIGICLNITPDHLDRYRDMDEYVFYKKIMFRNQQEDDIAVLNAADPYLRTVEGRARRVGFSFNPPSSGDGAFLEGSRVCFQGSIAGQGPMLPEGRDLGNGLKEDMLVSALVARLLGVDSSISQEVFADFEGIHHRFEHVATIDGVSFVDDSKATNVGALETALSGMRGPVILILGGKDKGGDFSHIARRFSDRIRMVIAIGEAAGRIVQEVSDIVDAEYASDMEQAVKTAFKRAASGDTVLLSPGCASFDMFQSYAHRGGSVPAMRTLDQMIPELDFDMVFFLTTLVLLVMGTIMIFSSSYFISKEMYGSSFVMIKKHLFHLAVGAAAMVYLIHADYRKFNTRIFILAILGLGIITCVLCFVPGVGITGGHARRWIRAPFVTVQASEIMKIALIFYLAYYLSKKSKKLDDYRSGVLPVLGVVAVSALLIFIEPDFGTAATIGLWSIFILYIAGMRIKHLIFTFLMLVPAAITMMVLEPYRRARLLAFRDPWEDMQGIGYQIIQSMVALANGGVFGSGLGEGTQKLFFLPAPHTDFILSVLGEELGFIGVLFVVTLFGLWVWRGYSIALATNDDFGFFLVISAVSLLGLQAIVNMGVAMSLLPTTGIALPFFSYGGSSMVTAMVASGIVLSVSRRARL